MLGLPMMVGLICIADVFVPWFFGDGYDKTIVLIKILSTLLCIVGISSVTGVQYFIPAGKQGLFTKSVLYGLCVNFCLNMVLIPRYLSVGAAIATVASELVVTISQLLMVRKEFSIRHIVMLGKNYFIAVLVMLIMLTFVNAVPNMANGIKGCVFRIALGCFVYGMILIVLKDEMAEYIIKILKRKI